MKNALVCLARGHTNVINAILLDGTYYQATPYSNHPVNPTRSTSPTTSTEIQVSRNSTKSGTLMDIPGSPHFINTANSSQ